MRVCTVSLGFILLLHAPHRAHGDVNLVGLVSTPFTDVTESGLDRYNPQATAVKTMMQFAAERVVADGTLLVGNISVTIVEAGTATAAAGGLCSALDNSTMAVRFVSFHHDIGLVHDPRQKLAMLTTLHSQMHPLYPR